ncbi:MAG: phosphatidylserine decarboxylase family protein [Bacteroidales bacterium]|nr:phosphatidylserine decarboxylase family protein [Bacteroidales bacterium]
MRIHKEGYSILASVFVFLAILNIVLIYLGVGRTACLVNLTISVLAFCFVLYFFRSPQRVISVSDESLLVAPADGKIVAIEPVEVQEYFGGQRMLQVSIFMSVFSVHANWYPLNGIVKHSRHQDGRHMAAYLPKSSYENERSFVVIEANNGKEIMLSQIAGALARRIVTYAAVGHPAVQNEHLGFIKFGSRVDIFLPLDSTIYVEMGERVSGNQTIIARLQD